MTEMRRGPDNKIYLCFEAEVVVVGSYNTLQELAIGQTIKTCFAFANVIGVNFQEDILTRRIPSLIIPRVNGYCEKRFTL